MSAAPDQPSTRSCLRLMLGDQVLLLHPGHYLLGRGPECSIVLDDPSASRHHARLRVEGAVASIEDLESVNGVFVNGRRIRHRVMLAASDVIVIGRHELRIEVEQVQTSERITHRPLFAGMAAVRDPVSQVMPRPLANAQTAKANAFELLATVAERALAAGHAQRAETALHQRLTEVLDGARACESGPSETIDKALSLSLRLAHALASRRWLNYAIELLTATRRPCSDSLVAELRKARVAAGPADRASLDAYHAAIQRLAPTMEKIRTLGLIGELAG
jgi:hypothetical protein